MNKRGFQRVGCTLAVTLHPLDGSRLRHHHITDLGLGGCYLETHDPAAYGTEFSIDLELPGGSVVQCNALVVRTGPSGMGLRFLDLEGPALQKLAQFVEQELAKNG